MGLVLHGLIFDYVVALRQLHTKPYEKNYLISVSRLFCKKCDNKGIMQFTSELLDIKERFTALQNRSDVNAIVKEMVQDHFKEEAECNCARPA